MRSIGLVIGVVSLLGIGCGRERRCRFETRMVGEDLTASWSHGADERTRSVECRRGQSSFKCRCLVDGVALGQTSAGGPAGSFPLPSLASLQGRDDATRTANEMCGWELEP